ncbi:FRG domain-containing protein [Agarivorans sp. JK6]|uniref:FRG domain-containing protein n=1 Tax=Agarivorans sp. JK6 TaxID=2997426 RepID=UPI003873422F
MKSYNLDSIDKVFQFATQFSPENHSVFRGVNNSEYDLIPSVGRLPPLSNRDEELDREKALLEQFKMKSALRVPSKPSNDWEWLSLAQHYGLPTRLLDWSINPLIALYFATAHSPEELYGASELNDCAVYVLISHIHIDSSYHIHPFGLDETLEFYAPNISERVINQAGLFTVHHNPRSAFDTEKLHKFVIPGGLKPLIQAKLNLLGVSESTIYPGLDGIAKSLKTEFYNQTTQPLNLEKAPKYMQSQLNGL